MSTPAFPLCWPDHIPRSSRRETSRFKTTLAGALTNVQDSLRKFGDDSRKPVSNIVLSSNCTLGATRPADPGVAAWFVWDGESVCIPVDRYETPEANLQAIHHVIEARRGELRHGTLHLVKATMKGFGASATARNQGAPAVACRAWCRRHCFTRAYRRSLSGQGQDGTPRRGRQCRSHDRAQRRARRGASAMTEAKSRMTKGGAR